MHIMDITTADHFAEDVDARLRHKQAGGYSGGDEGWSLEKVD